MAIIPGTIIVNFHANISEGIVEEYLDEQGLFGIQVSQLCNRYAIEVPPGKEQEYVDKFRQCELVRKVHDDFLEGKITPPKKRPNKDKKDENRRVEVVRASKSSAGKRNRGGW